MMTSAEIKKGKGIEELLRGYGEQAEVEKKLIIEPSVFERLTQLFEKELATAQRSSIVSGIKDSLTPDEINAFLQTTIKYESERNYLHLAGTFTSALIWRCSGYSDFLLDTRQTGPIHHLGYQHYRNIHVIGDVGGLFGRNSDHSRFIIEGNAGDYLGLEAEYSEYTVHGNISVQTGKGASECAFKTPNRETLEQMKIFVDKKHRYKPESSGNRVIFIDENGAEHVVRDYHDKC